MGKLKIGFILFCCSGCFSAATAQKALTLDSCRALALRNNKQLQVARVNKEMTGYAKKSARTQYLPKVDAVAQYSKSIPLNLCPQLSQTNFVIPLNISYSFRVWTIAPNRPRLLVDIAFLMTDSGLAGQRY